jgi:hypothetical protein
MSLSCSFHSSTFQPWLYIGQWTCDAWLLDECACKKLLMDSLETPSEYYVQGPESPQMNHCKQVSCFTLCCCQWLNPPISRPFHSISSGVAMSIVANLFFLCAFGTQLQSKCDIFWRFLLFVRLVAGQWKVSDSFHRTVETIKTWLKLTNFGGN